jgi:hypothetical protein
VDLESCLQLSLRRNKSRLILQYLTKFNRYLVVWQLKLRHFSPAFSSFVQSLTSSFLFLAPFFAFTCPSPSSVFLFPFSSFIALAQASLALVSTWLWQPRHCRDWKSTEPQPWQFGSITKPTPFVVVGTFTVVTSPSSQGPCRLTRAATSSFAIVAAKLPVAVSLANLSSAQLCLLSL